MGERVLDGLARAFAEPMPRRRSLRVVALALVAAIPALRPRPTRAAVAVDSSNPTAELIRRQLRAARPRLQSDVDRLVRAFDLAARSRSASVSASAVAALQAYRGDVLKLRAAIAGIRPTDSRGAEASRLTLAVLDLTAEGLEGFRQSALSRDLQAAVRLGTGARKKLDSAAALSGRVRKALGCGAGC